MLLHLQMRHFFHSFTSNHHEKYQHAKVQRKHLTEFFPFCVTLPVLFCLSNSTSSSVGFSNYGKNFSIIYSIQRKTAGCTSLRHILKGLLDRRKVVQPRKGICTQLNYRIKDFYSLSVFILLLYESKWKICRLT